MSVKKRDNGDFIITIPNPLTHAGVSTKVLQKVWVDELIKYLEETGEEGREIDWPPPMIEFWEPEGPNAFTSLAPDGRVAVILLTTAGRWAGKWRTKERDEYVTRMGINYSQEEIISIFRKLVQKAKPAPKLLTHQDPNDPLDINHIIDE